VGGVERFAQADRACATTTEQWDRDVFLLATPGGTVDLHTGLTRPARQEDYITRITAVATVPLDEFDPDLDCPKWLEFLDQATTGDPGLVRFLQQWFGYCLTGDTREHALVFVYGSGKNGKSVFLNTLAGIMGDYAATAAMDTFTDNRNDRHLAFVAMLNGARLVCASETEAGRAWNETLLKRLTGGDPITANFMRQDPFTFTPQFKPTFIGNHKPRIKNVDDATKRRFNMVPFSYVPQQVDQNLEAKLRSEWPGILAWAIRGCIDWRTNGLVRPDVVSEATEKYFEAQDLFGQWLTECCEIVQDGKTAPAQLFQSWEAWCAENRTPSVNSAVFREWLERTSQLRYATVKGKQWVKGIVLKEEDGDC
jgi:putative DNA primase/helicase